MERNSDHKEEPPENPNWISSLLTDIKLIISELESEETFTKEEKNRLRFEITTNCTKIINLRLNKKYLKFSEFFGDSSELKNKFEYNNPYQNKLLFPSQKMEKATNMIYILHISDIHLGTDEQAKNHLFTLKSDLKNELQVDRLNYIVISGDIAQSSAENEYDAALELISGIAKEFSLDSDKIIIVPGNHDLNWDLSEQSYKFIYKTKLAEDPQEGQFIPAGPSGILLRDAEVYSKRFDNFNNFFYKKICGKVYPSDPSEQGMLHIFPDDKIIFLAFNSCWEIDHHYKDRASINMGALSNALGKISDDEYKNWLRIAIWHHPVTGNKPMRSEFLERLAVCCVKICMHGHIHEAIDNNYKYDDARGIKLIGAGTFGARLKDQDGIPLQYNLLKLNPETQMIIVETRRREKEDGAWSADPRWGDKKDPSPRYLIHLNH